MSYCLVTKEHLKKQDKLTQVFIVRVAAPMLLLHCSILARGPDALDQNTYNI